MRYAAVAALMLLSVAGCSDGSKSDVAGPVTSVAEPATSTSVADALEWTTKTSIEVSAPVLRLNTWGHRVAWSSGADIDHLNQIVVWDTDTDDVGVVAHSSWPGGQTDWVRGSDNYIVFTDQEASTDITEASAPWKLRLLDLSSGHETTIAESAPESGSATPFPVIDVPYVAWLESDGAQVSMFVYDLRDQSKRKVLSPSDISVVWVDGDDLVYVAPSGPNTRDVFRVAIDGTSPPTQLSTSGAVAYAVASDGDVTWDEPLKGSPEDIWARFGGGEPLRIVGGGGESNEKVGDGFVAWIGFQNDVVVGSSPDSAITLSEGPVSIFARIDASGDRVVWAHEDADGRARIFVAESG